MKELDKMEHNALPEGKKPEKYSEGSSLDEFWSHKFLENIGKTMSIVQFRTEFKKIDANTDKRMGMIEFLVYEFGVTIKEALSRPQGGDPAEIKKAQDLVAEVAEAFNNAQAALDKASITEAEAKKTKEAAVASEAAAKKTAHEAATSAVKASETASTAAASAAAAAAAAAEQQAAVAALKQEEDTYAAKTADLTQKAEAGGVAGMRAKNELAQHQGEDPLPLRKAKLTAEAAAKKTDKANQLAQTEKAAADAAAAAAAQAKAAADAAAKAAELDRIRAEAAAVQAESDRVDAEAAVTEAEKKLAEAEAYLAEVKSRGGETFGTFWWINRELEERKKYMPKTGKAKLLF